MDDGYFKRLDIIINYMLHSLSKTIKYGVGVDFSYKCINAANLVKDLNKQSNLNFYVFNLDKEDFRLINDFILMKENHTVDICMFLAVAMHVEKWKEVIQFCYDTSNVLLFESNERNRQQLSQVNFVKSLYNKVTFLMKDSRREMFLCEK